MKRLQSPERKCSEIKCSEIFEFIEKAAPAELAEEWDNSGLIIGSGSRIVDTVLFCLDLTWEVCLEAVRVKADLIVSHHPFIFKPIGNIDEDSPRGMIISEMIRNSITVYAAHTNLDNSAAGAGIILAEEIGLVSVYLLQTGTEDKKTIPVVVGHYNEPVMLKDLTEKIKNILKVKILRITGSFDTPIKRASILCGSYDPDYLALIKQKSDILITGDLKHHHALDIKAEGLTAIDAGHYAAEKHAITKLAAYVGKHFNSLKIVVSEREEDPIVYI